MRKYFLYSLNDPDSNIPRYIGITNNPEKRFNDHLIDNHNTKKCKWILSLKEGNKIPILNILKEAESIEEIANLEIKTIAKYKEIYPLTNSTLGGEYNGIGHPIDVYDLDGNYINSWNSMTEFCEDYNWPIHRTSNISACCMEKKYACNDLIFRYKGDILSTERLEVIKINYRSKKNYNNYPDYLQFYIYDLFNNILGDFLSFKEAEELGFGKAYDIKRCLFNKDLTLYLTVNGNIISFSQEDYIKRLKNYLLSINKHGKWINQYNLDGKYIKSFVSSSKAADEVGVTKVCICDCLNGKTSISGGYMWKYSLDTNNIKPYIKPKRIRKSKPIYQYTQEGNFIKKWNNTKEVANFLGVTSSTINKNLNKNYKGYVWTYEDSIEKIRN